MTVNIPLSLLTNMSKTLPNTLDRVPLSDAFDDAQPPKFFSTSSINKTHGADALISSTACSIFLSDSPTNLDNILDIFNFRNGTPNSLAITSAINDLEHPAIPNAR